MAISSQEIAKMASFKPGLKAIWAIQLPNYGH
jgi:hypothetical protein